MARFYLDTDTTPPVKGGYVTGSLAKAKAIAEDRLEAVTEGQIGIYTSHIGDGFQGYAIKYAGQEPYFEAAE